MLNVKNLSAEDKLILGNMNRHHSLYASRIRAHAVLLSNTGFSLTELSETFGVCRQTAATWLNAWEAGGASALLDKPRSGRPVSYTHLFGGSCASTPMGFERALAAERR